MKTCKYIIMLLVVLFIGCEPENPVDSDELLADGWNLFMTENYTPALGKFTEALNEGDNNVEAWCGIGWCQLYLGYFSESETDFLNSVNIAYYSDSYAGLVFAAKAQNHFDIVIDASLALLYVSAIENNDYQFQYDPAVDWWDVRLALAQAYFHTGEYESCYNQVQILDPLIVLDPDSETFVEDLLAVLEYLEG